MEIVKLHPGKASVESALTSGKVFDDADLSDPDGFVEFDEDANAPVSVSDVEFRVVAA